MHITLGFNWNGFVYLHRRSERFADGQCMLGLRRAEVIFDLTGVFICSLGEGYGCFFVISCSCCNECAYMKH